MYIFARYLSIPNRASIVNAIQEPAKPMFDHRRPKHTTIRKGCKVIDLFTDTAAILN